jgi:pimeloyl-ACP methyl ester carboxylesterase
MGGMTTFVLVPGAGGSARYFHRLVAALEQSGYQAIPVDIREDDPSLGLPEYADVVEHAIGGRDDVVLVAQSMGAFTAAVVAHRVRLRGLVLLNAMIPLPNETPGEWWEATGQPEARRRNDEQAGRPAEFDPFVQFLHDVPPDVVAAGESEQRAPADTPFGQPCEFERWPDVPLLVLVGSDDRFFPPDFQRRVARERLGVDAETIRGGHLVALSNPEGLADRLVKFADAGRRGRTS